MKPSFNVSLVLVVLTALFSAAPAVAAEEPVVIRLGTILPSGTGPHTLLQELAERWRQESGGAVKLVLFPDGRLGGEAEMVKKMRIKQLNAGVFSVTGLSDIDPSATGLQMMPLMFHSWAEVDYVREQIRPLLEQRLHAKGYEVLFWADAGWVHFFSKEPATLPGEYKKMKMFVWAGDNAQINIMQAVGYQPVPLEVGDILMGLNTNMITTVAMPPLVALAGRVNGAAPHMLDMDWVPMVGAAVVRSDVWEKIPPALRAKLQKVADEVGVKIRARGRLDGEESVTAMQQHGLQVHARSPEAQKDWQVFADDLNRRIRGTVVPADIFDAVVHHVGEFRANHPSAP